MTSSIIVWKDEVKMEMYMGYERGRKGNNRYPPLSIVTVQEKLEKTPHNRRIMKKV